MGGKLLCELRVDWGECMVPFGALHCSTVARRGRERSETRESTRNLANFAKFQNGWTPDQHWQSTAGPDPQVMTVHHEGGCLQRVEAPCSPPVVVYTPLLLYTFNLYYR